jgi:hypothetical protein
MFAKPSLIVAGFAVGLAALIPSKAEAHRRWLLPSATVLSGEKEIVSVDAAASNGLFIFEHAAMPLDDLSVLGPDGQPTPTTIVGRGKYRSVFDVELAQPGTYRIAIASHGAMGFYELNGERQRVRGSDVADARSKVPQEAVNVSINNTSQRVETFVTLGAPNEVALSPTGRGLEMAPMTHPNDLVAGEPAQVRFLFEGQPAAGLEIEFVEGGTRYRDDAGIQTLTTDPDGMVTLNVDNPGMYYLEAGTTAEDGARASYTAVIEFMPL